MPYQHKINVFLYITFNTLVYIYIYIVIFVFLCITLLVNEIFVDGFMIIEGGSRCCLSFSPFQINK
jgi:hypothetical protein